MPAHNIDAALVGMLVPDPLITEATRVAPGGGASDGDHREGSPCPGAPVWRPELSSLAGTHGGRAGAFGVRGPDLRPVVAGDAQGDDLWLRVSRAGMPGEGCEVVLGVTDVDQTSARPIADGVRWYGWSQPHVLEELQAEVTLNRGIDEPGNLAMVEADDGRVVALWANSRVYARRFDPRAGVWEAPAVDVLDPGAAMAEDAAGPILGDNAVEILRLPSGRLLALYLARNTDGDVEPAASWSDDHGVTWRAASIGAADVAIPWTRTITSMSAGLDRHRDAVLLVIGIEYTEGGATKKGWVQLASADAGASFGLVEDWADGSSTALLEPSRPKVVADPLGGGLLVIYGCLPLAGVSAIRARRVATPWAPLRGVTEELVASTSASSAVADVVAWVDPAGSIYVAWTPAQDTLVSRTDDGGASWAALATPLHAPGAGALDRLFVAPLSGRRATGCLWAAGDTATGVRAPQVLLLCASGGWQMLCQPRVAGGHPAEQRAWERTWLPYAGPVALGWTLTGTATSVATAGTWRLELSGSARRYSATTSGASTRGTIVHAEVSNVLGRSDLQAAHIEIQRGAYFAEVRLGTGDVRIYDVHGAADVATASLALANGDRYHLRVAVQGARIAVYAAKASGQTWQLLAAGSLASGGAGTDHVAWGHGADGDPLSTWHRVSVAGDCGWGTAAGHTDSPAAGTLLSAAPDSLPGALLPNAAGLVAGVALPLRDGPRLAAAGGPGLRGETWHLPASDRHPPSALLSRSPAATWRSDTDEEAVRIVWEPAEGYPHHPGGIAPGVAIFNSNLRSAILQGWDGSAWQDVAEIDTAIDGLAFTRSGDTLRFAAGGTDRGQLRPLDLEGATVQLASGCLRRVASATSGTWAADSAQATMRLEGVDGTEPTSGTALLWLRCGAAVGLGRVASYSRWGLLIPAQATAEGYYEIGRLVIGAFLPFGARYSHGRVTTTQPEVSVSAAPGLRSGRRLSRPVRQISAQWAEGVPTRLHDPAPAYQSAGGLPLVSLGDLSLVETLQHSHGEGTGQLVYLPRIERDPAATGPEVVAVRGRDWVILATLTGAPTQEDLAGEELRAGVQRVAGLELVEEPSP